jgi:hypothetical protein
MGPIMAIDLGKWVCACFSALRDIFCVKRFCSGRESYGRSCTYLSCHTCALNVPFGYKLD